MGESLGTLLRAASEPVGDVRPPAVAELVARRRRRTGLRTAGAMLATVATVVTVAAVVANRPDRPGRHDIPPPISRPRPAAMGVTVDQLAGYRWRALPPTPIPPRDGAVAVWTGHQVIVWGGTRDDQDRSDGAAYDPVTRRWTTLPRSPVAGTDAQAVWTGRSIVVWAFDRGGASYDPAEGTWTRLPGVRDAGPAALVAWRGRAVLLHGAQYAAVVHADAYDAATNRWQHLPELRLAAHHELGQVEATVAGVDLYVWAEWEHTVRSGSGSDVISGIDPFRFDGAWRGSNLRPESGSGASGAAALGTSLFFPEQAPWCGCMGGPARLTLTGTVVDLRTGDRRRTPPTHGGQYAPTGRAVLALNTSRTGGGLRPGDLEAWEPGRPRWVRLPAAPLNGGEEAAVLWAGSRLFVWGSQGGLEFAG